MSIKSLCAKLASLRINDIMALSVGEVLDNLFEKEFGLSDEDNSDDDDEDRICDYLGGRVL